MPLRPGQLLQERYRIEALLGQGGMGAVYRATDLRLNIPVAVKENLQATPAAQRQFGREAGILAGLHHPNLPRVSDYFFLPNQGQYLVMDYVEGQDLGQIIARQGALPEAQAVTWIGQVLDALDYLHSEGIVHRDVKPANIKISPKGQLFLVDFGLAKVADQAQATTIGARAVTPGFAPPEQYGTGRTDVRTDVYSAGATLYALLTGKMPPDAWQLVTKQVRLTAPRRLQPGISPAVEAAVLRAMRLAPGDRFQTAAEFRAALVKHPPQAKRPGRPVTRPAWFWPAVGGAAALALALAVAIALLLGGGGRNPPLITAVILPPEVPTPTPTAAVTASPAATVAASPAPTASPVPTATPSPYLYWDDFSDPSSGWDIRQASGGAAGYVDGEYRLSQYEADHVRWANPRPALDLADVRVGVDARLVEGPVDNGIGLLVRAQADDMHFYQFEISSDGYYKIEKRGPDGWTTLLPWAASPAIRQGVGATNRLEVVCKGDHFDFYVNGTHLADLTDATYRSGNIGLAVTTIGKGGVVVAFDNLTVSLP